MARFEAVLADFQWIFFSVFLSHFFFSSRVVASEKGLRAIQTPLTCHHHNQTLSPKLSHQFVPLVGEGAHFFPLRRLRVPRVFFL
jgi:hypothetical protein